MRFFGIEKAPAAAISATADASACDGILLFDERFRVRYDIRQRHLRHLLFHGVLDLLKPSVHDVMDVAADGTCGVRILMKVEQLPVRDAIDGAVDIKERDVLELPRELHAAVAAALHDDEPRFLQLAENVAHDDGIHADAAGDRLAVQQHLPIQHMDARQDMDGDGETTRNLHDEIRPFLLYL